jgi:hypothetical protein
MHGFLQEEFQIDGIGTYNIRCHATYICTRADCFGFLISVDALFHRYGRLSNATAQTPSPPIQPSSSSSSTDGYDRNASLHSYYELMHQRQKNFFLQATIEYRKAQHMHTQQQQLHQMQQQLEHCRREMENKKKIIQVHLNDNKERRKGQGIDCSAHSMPPRSLTLLFFRCYNNT